MSKINSDDKSHCDICRGKGFHVGSDDNDRLIVRSCDSDRNDKINQFYCDSLNRQNYNLNDPITREKIIRRFSDKAFEGWPEIFISEVTDFVNNWTKFKRKKKISSIIENPVGRRIVRVPEKHQNTAIHLFTRNQVFQIIADRRRKQFTSISKIDGKIDDIPVMREFVGWGKKVKFTIKGPILCDYDQQVFDALTKIWHEKYESKWCIIKTSLREIWKYMGNSSNMGSRAIESLKRSLERLVQCSVSAKSLENKDFWIGGILDDVSYKDDKENKIVVISFNKYMMRHYLEGAYSTIIHPVYVKLKPITQRLYLFLMSHADPERKMSIEKFIEPLGIDSEIEIKELKRNLNTSIKELKEFKILDSVKSNINARNEMCTVVMEGAWNAKPAQCGIL